MQSENLIGNQEVASHQGDWLRVHNAECLRTKVITSNEDRRFC